jgi:hypothetical protein
MDKAKREKIQIAQPLLAERLGVRMYMDFGCNAAGVVFCMLFVTETQAIP